MYDPPLESNWVETGLFFHIYTLYYDKGYNNAKLGKPYKEPFEESDREKDTTFHDDLNYWYYAGYHSYEQNDK